MDSARTQAALTYVAEVLGEIRKTKAKEAVEDIRDRLYSDEPEEHPAKAENTDLKERLAEMSDQLAAVKIEKAEYEDKLRRLEAEKVEYEELLDAMEKENAELKERLSETENLLKTIELESDEHIETLTDTPELEERYKTMSIEEWRRKIIGNNCATMQLKRTLQLDSITGVRHIT